MSLFSSTFQCKLHPPKLPYTVQHLYFRYLKILVKLRLTASNFILPIFVHEAFFWHGIGGVNPRSSPNLTRGDFWWFLLKRHIFRGKILLKKSIWEIEAVSWLNLFFFFRSIVVFGLLVGGKLIAGLWDVPSLSKRQQMQQSMLMGVGFIEVGLGPQHVTPNPYLGI